MKKTIRPTVRLEEDEYKKIRLYCVEKDYNISEFLKLAAIYCVDKEVKFKASTSGKE